MFQGEVGVDLTELLRRPLSFIIQPVQSCVKRLSLRLNPFYQVLCIACFEPESFLALSLQNLMWESDVEGRIGYTLCVRKKLTLFVKIELDLIGLHALQVVFKLSVLVCEVLCDLLELHNFVFPDIE